MRTSICAALDPLLGQVERCALVGFPDHGNPGDSGIWRGERAYLQAHHIRVAYACTRRDYQPSRLARAVGQDGVILIHGGGNFGDTWPKEHAFAKRVIAEHQDKRIVVMPQTVHFSVGAELEATRAVVARHPAITLLARDRQSYVTAREDLRVESVLCPDMAVFLKPDSRRQRGNGIVFLSRRDRERADHTEQRIGAAEWQGDWSDSPIGTLRKFVLSPALRARRIMQRPSGHGPLHRQPATLALMDLLAKQRLGVGLDLLRSAAVVVTDRLHGYILSVLLGTPTVLFDNSYGKNRAYYEAWAVDGESSAWADHPDQALELALSWTRRVRQIDP